MAVRPPATMSPNRSPRVCSMGNRKGATAIARFRAVVMWLAVGLSAVQTAAAQTLTGTLSGTVKDEQGGVLAGAIVRLTSPALMTGTLQTTSSDKGQWRFPVLPPGEYTLTVELSSKFKPFKEEGIRVGAGEILERQVALPLAGVAETVTVAATPADSRGTGLETRRNSDYISTIPSRRFSMFDLFRGVVGVSPTSPSSATVNSLTVFGSAVNENLFLID